MIGYIKSLIATPIDNTVFILSIMLKTPLTFLPWTTGVIILLFTNNEPMVCFKALFIPSVLEILYVLREDRIKSKFMISNEITSFGNAEFVMFSINLSVYKFNISRIQKY
ncbi:hypothetical protein CN304_05195 [Bacillus thuringiensis]|nr:hypothetical protein CN304_05195 [Bacillus thuringiensis]PFU88951.1 hypothetical protein COK93_21065 [Bacillus thuringiensis]